MRVYSRPPFPPPPSCSADSGTITVLVREARRAAGLGGRGRDPEDCRASPEKRPVPKATSPESDRSLSGRPEKRPVPKATSPESDQSRKRPVLPPHPKPGRALNLHRRRRLRAAAASGLQGASRPPGAPSCVAWGSALRVQRRRAAAASGRQGGVPSAARPPGAPSCVAWDLRGQHRALGLRVRARLRGQCKHGRYRIVYTCATGSVRKMWGRGGPIALCASYFSGLHGSLLLLCAAPPSIASPAFAALRSGASDAGVH